MPVHRNGGEDEIFRSISPDRENRTFAASVNRHDHPGEVYAGTLQNEGLTRLTHHNSWLDERELGEQSSITWDLYWFDNPGQNWERSPAAWLQQADTPLWLN